MLLPLALFAVMLTGSQAPQQSLLRQVVPNPTGANGYEDYLKAADILREREASYYINWTPTKYGQLKEQLKNLDDDPLKDEEDYVQGLRTQLAFYQRLDGKTLLEVRAEAVKRWGRALELLHAGNQKRVWDPRDGDLHAWTAFPEYASFKQLAKFGDLAAYVAFAEGRGRDGSRILIDTLQLGQNLEGGIIISHLVGIAIESISLAGFERFLPNVSRADAATIENFIARSLAAQPKVIDAVKTERAMTLRSLQDVLFPKRDEDVFGDDSDGARLGKYIQAMSAEAKQALIERATARMNGIVAPILTKFNGPESDWIGAQKARTDEEIEEEDSHMMDSPESFVGYLVDSARDIFEGIGSASAKNRTQMRLMGLHAAVMRYKWDTGKLPASLEEVVPANLVDDPLSGQKFVYEPQGVWGFRIYSMGTKETGQIALKYKKPNMVANDTDPVPPR